MTWQDQATEVAAQASGAVAKGTPVVLGGQYIFGYTINEFAALVGIVVTLVQFSWWLYEKIKGISDDKDNK